MPKNYYPQLYTEVRIDWETAQWPIFAPNDLNDNITGVTLKTSGVNDVLTTVIPLENYSGRTGYQTVDHNITRQITPSAAKETTTITPVRTLRPL